VGGRASLLESYEKLAAANAEAPRLHMELEVCRRTGCSTEAANRLVGQSNDLATLLRRVEASL
jgi:hypothetical protein